VNITFKPVPSGKKENNTKQEARHKTSKDAKNDVNMN
jgi:hypothetical protein